jgi:hypothetical protein
MSYTTQTSLVLRNTKGSVLTYDELDGNQYFLSQSIQSVNTSTVKLTGNQVIGGNKTFTNNVNVGGTLGVTGVVSANDFVLTSDERLKTEVNDLQNALEVLDRLRPVSYLKQGQEELGFIAQEVYNVLPNIVKEGEDNYLYLSYLQLISLNTAAIQEINKKLDTLIETFQQVLQNK